MLLVATVLLFAGCTAGPNPHAGSGPSGDVTASTGENAPNSSGAPTSNDGRPAGFLLGLWHGFIALFAFVVSLFSDNVGVYEVYNSGGWYDFGFILGAMMFFGGGGGGASRRGCRDR